MKRLHSKTVVQEIDLDALICETKKKYNGYPDSSGEKVKIRIFLEELYKERSQNARVPVQNSHDR